MSGGGASRGHLAGTRVGDIEVRVEDVRVEEERRRGRGGWTSRRAWLREHASGRSRWCGRTRCQRVEGGQCTVRCKKACVKGEGRRREGRRGGGVSRGRHIAAAHVRAAGDRGEGAHVEGAVLRVSSGC